MKMKFICISTCLIIAISISTVAETLKNENSRNISNIGFNWQDKIIDQNEETNLIEMEYTHLIGFISNYSLDEYNVTFHAEFLFINFFCPWEEGYAGFVIDTKIYFNIWTYGYWFIKTRPGPKGISFYFATYYNEVEIDR